MINWVYSIIKISGSGSFYGIMEIETLFDFRWLKARNYKEVKGAQKYARI